jgi:peptidoglycan hydrolase CwlO-like protein
MIQGLIIKKILDLVMKQILKQFNLDKIQKYVEEPNELDEKVVALQKKINKLEKNIKSVKDRFGKNARF